MTISFSQALANQLVTEYLIELLQNFHDEYKIQQKPDRHYLVYQ